MTTERTDSTRFIAEPEPKLLSPRFDETAAANAQPVQPIPVSRGTVLTGRFASILPSIIGRSRMLAVVVIAGLIIGTLGGLWWVNDRNEPIGLAAESESLSTLPVDADQGGEPDAAVIGRTDPASAQSTLNRVRKSRKRARSGRAPRAYRVAVLH
jgi:hypothetical protein